MARYQHVLIIGGTGMLLEAAVALASRGRASTWVARTDASEQRLADRLPDRRSHKMVRLDWRRPATFLRGLSASLRDRPAPDVALAWLHDARLILPVAGLLHELGQRPAIYHVIGDARRDPVAIADEVRTSNDQAGLPACHQIVLGHSGPSARPRWLSDEEICAAVAQALAEKSERLIAGSTARSRER